MTRRKRTSAVAASSAVPTVDAASSPPSPTLGEIFGEGFSKVVLPEAPQGFAMQDEPFDDPRLRMPLEGVNPPDPAPLSSAVAKTEGSPPAISAPQGVEYLPPTDGNQWESRIHVLEAFQYTGSLARAPDWVDRNWIGWADYDPLRRLEPGSCLRVPADMTTNPSRPGENEPVVIARVGDYLVRQAYRFEDGTERLQLEVWAKESFEKTFIRSSPQRSRAA